jgi:hypothetical protein
MKRCACAATTPPGVLASSASACTVPIHEAFSRRSGPFNAGSSERDFRPPRVAAAPASISTAPPSRTRFGKWTPPSASPWPTDPKSVGYGWWTSAAARCFTPRFSPLACWASVPVAEVRTALQQAFRRWGRPLRLRVDNGVPWGSSGDLPPDLALWLLGLDVETSPNPPRRPQDNGVVERSQGTGKRWAEPGTCASAAELQTRLEEMDLIQREEYPSLQGRSRLEAYPDLKHSGRVYSRKWERTHWCLELVLAHLAGYAVPRKVDKSGTVSVYNRNHYVGKLHAGRLVYVMLDPQRIEWLFTDDQGRQLRTQPAEQISRKRIETLTVTHRR